MIKAKYVHTNIVAEDWKKLADFYIKVFGCEVVPPERNYKGKELDSGVNIQNVELKGVHLKLPGYEKNGPTLEIYSYSPMKLKKEKPVNQPGFTHIAFEVEDVEKAKTIVLAAGGRAIGEIVILQTSDGRSVKWCYLTDPEGNIIELQKWAQIEETKQKNN